MKTGPPTWLIYIYIRYKTVTIGSWYNKYCCVTVYWINAKRSYIDIDFNEKTFNASIYFFSLYIILIFVSKKNVLYDRSNKLFKRKKLQ